MRKLRTIITMIVTVAMLVTSLGVPAFAASFSDITDQRVSDAVDKLVGFNIITGYEDGTFKPDNQITRAEFAAIVTRMKGVADNLSADAVTGFSDLDNDSSRAWARPYVKAAVDLKIINGFEDGTFRAGEPVTYEQAVKMLVCAVGYEVVARSEYNKIIATNPNATWSAGYIAAANKHGITKGVITAKITEPAARGVVAVLTSNGLDVPEIKENEDGTFEKVDEEESSQNVEEIKGVVSGTYYTGIDAETAGITMAEINIGLGEEKKTYELSPSLREKIDFEDLIGKNVVAYYDKLDRQVTSVEPRNNTITLINEADVVSISGNTVKYRNASKNTETVSLSNYTIIYNGKYYPAVNMETEFKNGTIELIEAGGQKVAKVTNYEVFVVSSYDKTNEKIYFKYGKTYDNGSGPVGYYQFPAEKINKPVIYVDKVKKDFDAVSFSQYNVINYMETPSSLGGNKIKKMYVTTGSKSGKITAGLEEARKVELNSTKMTLTRDYFAYTPQSANDEEKAPFELGESYTYYVDYTGQIAAVKYNSSSQGTYKYGYISAAGKSGSSYAVDIIAVDTGSVTRYEVTSNIKVDGNPVSESAVVDALKTAKSNITNTYSNLSDVAQPIRYMVSGSSLKAIDTLTSGAGGANDNFSKQITGDADSTVTKSSIKQGSNSYSMLSSTTKVLYVPDDVLDTTSYAKLSLDSAFRTSGTKKVEAFNIGSDKVAPFVIVYGAANPSHVFVATSPYMIVKSISYSGEVMTITGYKNASTTESTATVDPEYFKGSAISGSISNYEDVEKGDLIRYIENNGKVVAIEIWYDASNPSRFATLSNRFDDKSDSANSRYYRYGMVVAASDETGLVALSKYVPTDSASTEEKAAITNATYFKCKSAKIYELDSDGNVSVLESLASINGYDEAANTASIAIMITPYNTAESAANILYIVK